MLFVLLGLTEHIDSTRPVSNASGYCARWYLVLSEYAGKLTEGIDTSLSTFERGEIGIMIAGCAGHREYVVFGG